MLSVASESKPFQSRSKGEIPRRLHRSGGGGGGWDYSWDFEVEVCLISDQKLVIFYTRFQTWRRQKLCHHLILRLELTPKKDFLKSISNSDITLSVLFSVIETTLFEIRSFTSVFSRKPYPNSDQNRQGQYPFSDQNWAKTLPFRAAHACMENIITHFKKYSFIDFNNEHSTSNYLDLLRGTAKRIILRTRN